VRERLAVIVRKAGWTGDKVPPLARSASEATVTGGNGYAKSLLRSANGSETSGDAGTSGSGGGSLEGSQERGVSEQGGQPRADSSPQEEVGTSYGTRGVQVGIIMGSDSDLPVMSAAASVLDDFGIPYEVGTQLIKDGYCPKSSSSVRNGLLSDFVYLTTFSCQCFLFSRMQRHCARFRCTMMLLEIAVLILPGGLYQRDTLKCYQGAALLHIRTSQRFRSIRTTLCASHKGLC
jgi:hypothetical protein